MDANMMVRRHCSTQRTQPVPPTRPTRLTAHRAAVCCCRVRPGQRWDAMIQKKAAAVLNKKRPQSPFTAHPAAAEQSNEPLTDQPTQLSTTASQHSTTLPHTTLPSAAADTHPKH